MDQLNEGSIPSLSTMIDEYKNKIIQGDCVEVMKTLPDNLVDTMITSPPYWGLRDYGVGGQLGLEKTPEEYVTKMVEVFREIKRVLKKEGTCWLNLGDSYLSAKCDYMPNQTIAGNKKRDYIKRGSGLGYPPNRIKNKRLSRNPLAGSTCPTTTILHWKD